MNSSKIRSVLVLLLASLPWLAGCADKQAFEEAEQRGDIAAYRSFLGRHPQSSLAGKARARVWELTKKENSVAAYETYYDEQRGDRAAQARAIEGIWRIAQNENSISEFEAFLAREETSAFHEPALEALWKLVERENNIDAYDAFRAKHETSPFATKAAAAADALWKEVTLEVPTCELTSELTVDVRWRQVAGASGYIVEGSSVRTFPKLATRITETTAPYSMQRDRVGTYSAKLPRYFRATATRNGVWSKPSGSCVAKLLPGEGGRCQICGAKSAGFCHLRAIHVCDAHSRFTDDGGSRWQCP